jgi:predicted DNA-binding transcriptional regulator AlpA
MQTTEPRPGTKRAKRANSAASDLVAASDGDVSAAALGAATQQPTPPAQDAVASPLMTLDATCVFFGGDRPLNPSTLYRGVRAGQYPPPVLLGPQNPRWVRSECMQALERLIKERNKYSSSRWLRQGDAQEAA